MTTATVMDVAKALDCGRYIADDKLAGIPHSLQRGPSGRPRKTYALENLPEDIRGRVEYYLVNGHPQPRAPLSLVLPTSGPADMDAAIRTALEQAITKSGKSRDRIASEMSELLGRKVTKFNLDSYTAASRTPYRFPLAQALAFEIATDSFCLTRLLAKRRGCGLLIGEDIALVELARIERAKLALEHKAEEIRKDLGAKR